MRICSPIDVPGRSPAKSALGELKSEAGGAIIPTRRPSRGPLAPSSQHQAFVILNVMFSWLVNAGYWAGNPLSLSRQRARAPDPTCHALPGPRTRSCVKQAIDRMPREMERQRAHFSELVAASTLLHPGGLRVSEVCDNTMGRSLRARDRHGEDRWRLEARSARVTRPGWFPRRRNSWWKWPAIGASPAGRQCHRQGSRHRSDRPIGKSTKPLTRAALHSILKDVFSRASDEVRQRGDGYAARADQLARASAHWLRHTAGSRMADAALDLGHVKTTSGMNRSKRPASTCIPTTIVATRRLNRSTESNGDTFT